MKSAHLSMMFVGVVYSTVTVRKVYLTPASVRVLEVARYSCPSVQLLRILLDPREALDVATLNGDVMGGASFTNGVRA